MIDTERLIGSFCELTAINNSSLREKELCSKIKEKLSRLGISYQEDHAAEKISGNSGNLYAYVPGLDGYAPLLFSAHMDSVEPASGKKMVIHSDGKITSDGTTVLGADDIAGVCAILEALTSVIESGAEHRPIEILFDVAEEIYCAGIQQFDRSKIKSKEVYVFDLSGPVGTAANQAPTIVSFRAEFRGRSAHAAFSPENGIHAIKAASHAVASIECGRVEDTTVNVGTICGGRADNVVPDHCIFTGEVRGFDDDRVNKQLMHIRQAAEHAAEECGASVVFTTKTLCLAYHVAESAPVAARFRKICESLGFDSKFEVTYGGSDNNYFSNHGMSGIVVAPGMNHCHSCEEYSSISELEKAARLAEAFILSRE